MLNKRYANRLQAMLVAAICILLVLLGRMAYMQLSVAADRCACHRCQHVSGNGCGCS